MTTEANKQADDSEFDQTCVVPRIKSMSFLEAVRSMDVPPGEMPVTEKLGGDLLLTYAMDVGDTFQMVNHNTISSLRISVEQLREIAIRNLREQLPEIGFTDFPPVQRIVTGGNLEACTLLAGSFWDQIAEMTEGEVVAVVPSRDVLLFCSSASPEGIDALERIAKEVLKAETTHGLSDQLMVWRHGHWETYR